SDRSAPIRNDKTYPERETSHSPSRGNRKSPTRAVAEACEERESSVGADRSNAASDDSRVEEPGSGLPANGGGAGPDRARATPSARVFPQHPCLRHDPRPLRLGDTVLPAILHPDI